MTLPVVFTDAAVDDIDAADVWWRLNRPRAPDAIAEAIERAIELLSEQPGVGQRVAGPRVETRKLVLRSIGYHLFYRVGPARVEVLRFWHGRRSTPPRL